MKLYSFIQARINQWPLNGKNSMVTVQSPGRGFSGGHSIKSCDQEPGGLFCSVWENLCAMLRPQPPMTSYDSTVNHMEERCFPSRTHSAMTKMNEAHRQGKLSWQKWSRDIFLTVLLHCCLLYVIYYLLLMYQSVVGCVTKMLFPPTSSPAAAFEEWHPTGHRSQETTTLARQ